MVSHEIFRFSRECIIIGHLIEYKCCTSFSQDTLLEESRDMGIDIARLLLSAQQKIIAKLLENSSFSKQTREVSSQTDFFPTKPLEQASIVDAHFQSNFTLGSKQVRTISEPLRNGGQSSPGGVRGNLLSCDAPGVVPAPISPSQKQTINAVSSFTPGTSDVTATLAAQPRPQFASNLASSLNLAASQNLVDHHANQRLNRGVKEIGGTEKILKRQDSLCLEIYLIPSNFFKKETDIKPNTKHSKYLNLLIFLFKKFFLGWRISLNFVFTTDVFCKSLSLNKIK